MAFHLARLTSYASGGALAAASLGALATWSRFSPALQPFWVLLNAGAVVLGLSLIWRGRQPAWMARLGRAPSIVASASTPDGWASLGMPARAAGTGALWVAWPCGLLQSALVVASLTNSAAQGALTMASFALASAPGLLAGPWLLRRLVGTAQGARRREDWACRAGGFLLASASAWALLQQLAPNAATYCRTLW